MKKRRRVREKVEVPEPHLQSRAAFLLLRWSLGKLDPIIPEYEKWLAFRLEVLREREKDGELNCFYCGCGPLLAEAEQDDLRCSTLDHVLPLAAGGPKYDRTNLLVACKECNGRKRDMSVDKFLELLGLALDNPIPV